MRQPLFRILLAIEYLVAVQVLIAFWAHAGGQFHLDLMFWPWKLVLPVIGAAIVVALTVVIAETGKWRSARALLLVVSLIVVMLIAGIVTYYYHVNEPADEGSDQDQPARITKIVFSEFRLAQTAAFRRRVGLLMTNQAGHRNAMTCPTSCPLKAGASALQ